MAAEVQIQGQAGEVYYALVRDVQARPWRPASVAFETYNPAHYANYATSVSLASQGASGYNAGDFPVAITTPGIYVIDVRRRVGASPAESDPPFGGRAIIWDGSAEIEVSALTQQKIATALLDLAHGVETGETVRQLLRLLRAVLAGVSDVSGNTVKFYRADGTTVALTATIVGSARTSMAKGTV